MMTTRTFLVTTSVERRYPRIYEPMSSPSARLSGPKYLVYIQAEQLDDELRGLVKISDGFVTASSKFRPEVQCSKVDELVTELDRLRARNLTFDHVFRDRDLMAVVEPFEYRRPEHGHALLLRSVRVFV